MKLENNLEGASNFRAWKKRIDLILAKNKVLDIIKGKIMEPQFEEIISEKELVNIVLNGLPKTWDAFSASMNTRKEYPTFEELWTCCAQEESRISAKEKPQKKYDDQAFISMFKNFRNKRKFGSRKKPNQEKDMSKIQCFNCRKYGHYKNHCLS
jgi:hypothetical protein